MDILLWQKLLEPYKQAMQELELKFNRIRTECAVKGLYCPFETVRGRVKSLNSILDKMYKKKISFDEIEERIEDICGIRIICQFTEDIEQIVEIIRGRQDMEVKTIKDYVLHQKASGYRSYHLIIYYTVQTLEGPKRIMAEIQVRTMAMDLWATIEHSLQYKYRANIPKVVSERLGKAADAIMQMDNEMSSVRSEIMDAQVSSQLQHRMVSSILYNIERLYRVANQREVQKIQDEFYQIYQKNDIEELRRFQTQLDLIAEGYRAQALDQEQL